MKKQFLFILALFTISCDVLENNIGIVSIYDEPSDYQLKKMIEHDPKYSDIYYFLKEMKNTGFWNNLATERLVMLEFKDKVNYKSVLSWSYEQRCKDMGDYGYDQDYAKRGIPGYSYMGVKRYARENNYRSVEEYNESTRRYRFYKYENFQDSKFQSYMYDDDYIIENEDSKIFEQFLTKTTNLAPDLDQYWGNFRFRYDYLETFIEDKFCETD